MLPPLLLLQKWHVDLRMCCCSRCSCEFFGRFPDMYLYFLSVYMRVWSSQDCCHRLDERCAGFLVRLILPHDVYTIDGRKSVLLIDPMRVHMNALTGYTSGVGQATQVLPTKCKAQIRCHCWCIFSYSIGQHYSWLVNIDRVLHQLLFFLYDAYQSVFSRPRSPEKNIIFSAVFFIDCHRSTIDKQCNALTYIPIVRYLSLQMILDWVALQIVHALTHTVKSRNPFHIELSP